MADKNLARSGAADIDLLSDDDPLAELARIVGYEPRNVPTAARPVPPEPLQEPVFDLEGELLREFARYDAPSLDPAGDLAEPVDPVAVNQNARTVADVVPAVERVDDADPEPAIRPEPVGQPPVAVRDEVGVEPEFVTAPVAPGLPAALPDAGQGGYEAVQSEASVPSAEPEEVAAPQSVSLEPAFPEPAFSEPAFLGLQPVEAPVAPVAAEPSLSLDLDQELELSLGEAFAEQPEPSHLDVPALSFAERQEEPATTSFQPQPHEDVEPQHADPAPHVEVHAYDPAAAGYAVVDTGATHAGVLQESLVESLPVLEPYDVHAAEATAAYAEPLAVTPAIGEGAHFEVEALPVEIAAVDFVPEWTPEPHAETALVGAEDLLSASVAHDAAAEAYAVAEPSYAVAPPVPAAVSLDLDELLAEVERFPVPESRPPVIAPVEPVRPRPGTLEGFSNVKFSRATPVAPGRQTQVAPVFSQPAAAAAAPVALDPVSLPPVPAAPVASGAFAPLAADPLAATPAGEPVIARAPALEPMPADIAADPVAGVSAADPGDPFANFELDLSDIEFDMDPPDLGPAPAAALSPAFAPEPIVAAAAVAPVAVAAARAAAPAPFIPTQSVAPAPAAPAPVMAAPVMAAPAVQRLEPAPVPLAPAAVGAVEREDFDSVLPFDPSLIAETDVSVGQVGDLNVPQLPLVERERPPVQQPDYDLDIDAEMAQLFAPDPAASGHAQGLDRGTAAPASGKAAPGQADEFDRALEEDLRRSLSQPERHAIPLDAQQVDDDYVGDGYNEPARRGRGLLIAAVAATAVVLGGGGVYAYLSSAGVVGSGSGEPRVIMADKEPVKIVPEERGGKSVPNQDKAVYDRVAGKQDAGPRQEQLVTTTEEPVDVVQRTLTPESLPNDGPIEDLSADGAASAAADDDRLLPGVDDQADVTSEEESKAPVVSPRKVRTMIVKPDGTLVAREESVTEPQNAPALAESTQPAETSGSAVANAGASAAAGGDAGLRAVASDTTAAAENGDDRALQEVAGASVDGTAPVRQVKTTTIGAAPAGEAATGAPVPATRPAEQPVEVVGTVTERGRVTDAPPTETAALSDAPAVQPETPAATAAAPANPGGYVIQIASLPSEADAQKSYNNLSAKFGVIAGRGVDIKRADIAGKGTYYRVRIPAGSREEANALCAKYKSAGGSCLVTR
ncbi:sporulation related protein [Rhizobium subbaraonis]|uniref:Sporulation related protein n=1 Tax=Rhizobium subbaraonis TaxID=908946 RepID=A0A285U916_9HYPH|nr:SPOR domain-containing protein [Rhizobium subbaraonis]SOC38197.1 sporulation related protein [Rhizobium subbaraonis]